ncbi:MAG: YhcB family protein [Gammaproteobacteria bacterium]
MAVLFAVGVVIGRTLSTGVKRIKLLQTDIQQTRAELDRTRTELEEARAMLEETRQEALAYRQQVTEHFSKAADLFNSLTVNYRAVYEHLAKSSYQLCDETTVLLSDGMPPGERRLEQTAGATAATEPSAYDSDTAASTRDNASPNEMRTSPPHHQRKIGY